jgi:hypothetical protein
MKPNEITAFLFGLSLRLCASARDVPSARFWLRLAAMENPWSFFRRSFRLPAHEAWHELAHEMSTATNRHSCP